MKKSVQVTYTIAIIIAVVGLLLFVIRKNSENQQSYFHNQGYIFGTYYKIRYEGHENLHELIKQRLQSIDQTLSMFNPESLISKINRNEEVTTTPLFEKMYTESHNISALSNGAFDITVAPLVNAWGFGTKLGNRQDTQVNIDSIKNFVGYEKIRLVDHHLQKDDERTILDASAIAKGYACDVVADLLREKGCKNFLVEIGGEVVLQGVNEKGKPWRIGISRPTIDATGVESSYQEIVESTNICLATSGNYLQYYYDNNGERRSHTIDPRIGKPVHHSLLSATVTASSCMRADALATACMVLGEKEALNMIECTPDAACYLIIASDNKLQVVTSSRWK